MTKKNREHFLFTSESVAAGHPDKIADQISDAILDACLAQDPNSRVACETMVATGMVILAGEITTSASLSYQDVVRDTIREIGYDDSNMGFDYRSCGILVAIDKQSPDIALGVDPSPTKDLGAGDQGIMFGYACDETPELMPAAIMFSHRIVRELKSLREIGELPYLRPDAKAQITIEYAADYTPVRAHTIVISAQHKEEASLSQISKDLKSLAHRIFPEGYIDKQTKFFINPTGRFVVGGPQGDCGLTGRKTMVDTYGGMARHGGGAFSGKDASKVDRSAAYAARYIAKNIVAAKLARRCEVQISYAIGVSQPISIRVETFGTASVSERRLEEVIPEIFDLTPAGIIRDLDLKRPIFRKTAFGGHFGRENEGFIWEKTDRAAALKNLF